MSRAQLTSTVEQNTGGAVSPYVAGKNAVINGGFDIWQRGTSFTGGFTADRWIGQTSAGTTTFARESTVVPTNSQYAIKWTQATASAYANIVQVIETANAIQFAGKTVTLSALVAASVGQGVAIELYYSTSVDKAFSGGGWTQLTATSGGSASPSSTTYIPASGVFSVPSTAKSLMVGITTTSILVGTTVYVSQVQLELGSTATNFSRAGGTLSGELVACQRYYYAFNGSTNLQYFANGFGYNSTSLYGPIKLPVTMRTNPTFSAQNATTTGQAFNGTTAIYATNITMPNSDSNSPLILYTFASGVAINQSSIMSVINGGSLTFSAEL